MGSAKKKKMSGERGRPRNHELRAQETATDWQNPGQTGGWNVGTKPPLSKRGKLGADQVEINRRLRQGMNPWPTRRRMPPTGRGAKTHSRGGGRGFLVRQNHHGRAGIESWKILTAPHRRKKGLRKLEHWGLGQEGGPAIEKR